MNFSAKIAEIMGELMSDQLGMEVTYTLVKPLPVYKAENGKARKQTGSEANYDRVS